MKLLDLDALDAASLWTEPCRFVVVPRFVRAELLEAVNRDFPNIEQPGNFRPQDLDFGPAFETLLAELHAPALRERFEAKLGVDLSDHPLDMTVRRYSELSDGNVHVDSRGKIVTALIYFNPEWRHAGGRLRLVRDPDRIDDHACEVVPEAGTLVAFVNSPAAYHGFEAVAGERRSLQMYWVKPKRLEKGQKKLTLKRRFKRWRKQRKRE